MMVRARCDALPALLIGAVLFAIYALGACPTIYVGDSGELVAAVHILGIPHPTGYPLYVILGKLWTLLVPIGSVAYRMSLFSAFFGAVACAILYRLCRALDLHPVAALLGALLLAFSPSFWGEANVQRVYTLNAFFVVSATATACAWRQHREGRFLIAAFFLCGLGATNHTFMAIYAVVLVGYAVVVEPSLWRRPATMAKAVVATVLGLLPYAYLPWRSRANPRLDWGNPETLSAFLDVVLRRDFWQRAWIESPADALVIAADYFRSLGTEFAWVGAGLAVLGVLTARRCRWPVILPLLIMAANLTALALHGSRSDIFIWHRYYIPSYAMAAILAALGAQIVIERLPRALRALALAVPLVLLASGWHAFDRGRYRIAEDFSLKVLRSLPPGAHLIATDDNILFVLIYLHLVEKHRPDIDLILQGVSEADLPPLRFNPDTDPLFFTHHPNWNLPSLEIVPVGVVFRAWRRGAPPPPLAVEPLGPLRLAGEDDDRVPKDHLTQNLIGHFHYMLGTTFEERDWLRARAEYAAAVAASPDNDVLFYNLGLIYRRNGLLDDAVEAFERSHAINPRHLANVNRQRASDRLAEVRAEQARLALIEDELASNPALQGSAAGSAAYHRRMADLLEARGEVVAARGHRLLALEAVAGSRRRGASSSGHR